MFKKLSFSLTVLMLVFLFAAPTCKAPQPLDIAGTWFEGEGGHENRTTTFDGDAVGGYTFVTTGGEVAWDTLGSVAYYDDTHLKGTFYDKGGPGNTGKIEIEVVSESLIYMTYVCSTCGGPVTLTK